MDPDDGLEDEEGPALPWLPPDDRLWRHPSEMIAGHPVGDAGAFEPAGPRFGRPARASAIAGYLASSAGTTRMWAVAVVAGLVGALAASGFGIATGVFQQDKTIIRSVMQPSPAVSLAFTPGGGVDWTSIEDAVAPSVVSVNVSSPSGPVTGSGVLFIQSDSATYVMTDSSLLAGAGNVVVGFQSGQQVHGTIINEDPLTGLALLSIPWAVGSFPTHGSVADLQLASPVLAVGAPGTTGGSVFPASVSAEDRALAVTGGAVMQNLIAITIPSIPPAAAGGPLVDKGGRIIGITLDVNPVNSADQSLSYAVPIDVADHVAQQMIDGTRVTHPWLGVTEASDLSSAVSRQLGLPGGASVIDVSPGSPASRMGLSPQDIITSFDRFPVVSAGGLINLLETKAQLDQTVPIEYVHDGLQMRSRVFVSSQPDND